MKHTLKIIFFAEIFFSINLAMATPASRIAIPIDYTPTKASLKKYPAKTELSQKALKLKIGMTKKEVLKLLGKPTWADSYKEEPLAWAWTNGNCNPVRVTFNKDMLVTGFDEGRAVCLKTTYLNMPDDIYLCSNTDRKKLCS